MPSVDVKRTDDEADALKAIAASHVPVYSVARKRFAADDTERLLTFRRAVLALSEKGLIVRP